MRLGVFVPTPQLNNLIATKKTHSCQPRRYGLDCIAPVLFGLDVDTIEDGQHTFRLIEHYANNHRYFYNLVPALVFLCPG